MRGVLGSSHPKTMIAHAKLLAAGFTFVAVAGLTTYLLAEPPAKPSTEKKMPTESTASADKKYTVPSDEELKKKLTDLQYRVAREAATERPGTNEYWRTKDEGIYVSIVTGEPLFSSKDKFDSECGWPAFAKPINDSEVKELSDRAFGMVRTEVRSKVGDAHLGHVFDDGPRELGGKR